MKLLVILSRFPYPLEKGDKLRAYHQIKELSRFHQIHLFAVSERILSDKEIEQLEPFCESITVSYQSKVSTALNVIGAFFRGIPLQAGYFYSRKGKLMLDQLIEKIKPEHLYFQLARTAEYAKGIDGIPKTIDYQDAFSKSTERRAMSSPFGMRQLLMMESRRLKKYESDLFDSFENKTIISEQDRDEIIHPEKEQVSVIRNGVDTTFFKPMYAQKAFDLLFIGNMSYPPNIDASRFLAREIFPIVLKQRPETKLLIAGADPVPAVRSLKNESIKVIGWVDDIREAYASSKIFIAPMRLGAGLQNKLLQAMAMKIPCITSELANNSLMAEQRKDILVGNTPEEFAAFVLELLNNPSNAQYIGEKGYEFVLENYDWTAITKKLSDIFEKNGKE